MEVQDGEWFLDDGEAESTLQESGCGNYFLDLDVVDAGLVSEGIGSLLMGMKDEVHVFVNQQANGSCRLLTIRLKPEGNGD
ncbi:MAG: hypothetical protein FJ125_01320 [Deltaproteobacteria bacterium]|nr:hypothetical protein [Deltaproteobacteria bacterium]